VRWRDAVRVRLVAGAGRSGGTPVERIDGNRPYTVRARERVLGFLPAAELDRLARLACAAAERSDGWTPGAEFVFELGEEPYFIPGIENSALVVVHRGADYEVLYYDGPLAETIGDHPSWE
jgi:hypothetical protein